MGKLYVVGIGPGSIENMSIRAYNTIKKCDVIVGYTKYIDMLASIIDGKEIYKNGMRGEKERCILALQMSKEKDVAIISTGDSGIYGMAGLVLELKDSEEVEIIPGISAAQAAASLIGAPLMHDHCSISLSDLMTPIDEIKKRVELGAKGDFVISLYNPKSIGRPHYLEECLEIIKKYRKSDTPVSLVKNALRDGQNIKVYTLESFDSSECDMMSIVIIGNSKSYIKDNYFITKRGYEIRGDKI